MDQHPRIAGFYVPAREQVAAIVVYPSRLVMIEEGQRLKAAAFLSNLYVVVLPAQNPCAERDKENTRTDDDESSAGIAPLA
jgi:hypothetical protein